MSGSEFGISIFKGKSFHMVVPCKRTRVVAILLTSIFFCSSDEGESFCPKRESIFIK